MSKKKKREKEEPEKKKKRKGELICSGNICVTPEGQIIIIVDDPKKCDPEVAQKLAMELGTGEASAQWRISRKLLEKRKKK